MTTTFYAPPSAIQGGRVVLPEDEARHALRVLRKRAGDEIIVVDGVGGWYRVRLDRVGEEKAMGTVLEARRDVGEPSYHLTIGLGLLKNRNRFETFVEKAVELGVSEIVPLHTARTEKEGLKTQRTENILIAAMKQCGRSRLPTLADPTPLPSLAEASTYDAAFIAHEQVQDGADLGAALAAAQGAERVLILVGPEGGFTDEEVALATEGGCTPVSLGARRLRAETAGITVAVAVHLALASTNSPYSL